ncbi:MAG: hypothetical protein ACM3MD_05425 [Betaproteobacteria bacterium]
MFKKVLTAVVTGSILMFSLTAFALTLDEAKTNIDKQAAEKKLAAKDHSQAVTTLQGLVDKGVPVEHAYRVVEASINEGMKGKDLAGVAKSIEAVGPAARKDAASVAADAIQHKYNARQTAQMTSTFGRTVAAGAPADKTSQVMSNGINKGLGAGRITAATNAYAGEIKSGTAPGKAADNATRTMDRDRTMQHDRDMSRDRDHTGSGPGMDHGGTDHGMDRGSGMGSGAGPGMGGSRR